MKYFTVSLIFMLVILSSIVSATDYYVRPASGDYGLEDGSDWDNAFDGFIDVFDDDTKDGFIWSSICAGDTIYMAAGTMLQSQDRLVAAMIPILES